MRVSVVLPDSRALLGGLAVGGLLIGRLLGPAHATPPDEFGPGELIPAAVEVYNELADDPLPFLSREQIGALSRGEVVRVRRRPPKERSEEASADRPERVVGYVLIERPRVHAWLAALDPEFQASELLTEVRLESDGEGGSLWYQHLSLPWPITDRHWVIRLWKETALCERSEGLIWQQSWDLAEEGPTIAARTVASGRAGELTPESVRDAIYLPHNRGSWILFELDERLTLLAYRVSTVVGGSIPDGWIATFAMAQLTGLLESVERHAAEAWRAYDPERTPIHDGSGRLIGRVIGRIEAPDR